MSASPQKWSVRTVNDKSGTYAVYAGRAYPKLSAEAPDPTALVQTDYSSRQSIYNDPVLGLNDSDMDALDGAEGAPICYEHNKKDVVGFVHHSWVDETDASGLRALDIIARIPIKDAAGNRIARGERIVQEVQAGKLKGFSVNYTADVRQRRLHSKAFHEISMVEDPFFDGCNLTAGVVASSNGGDGQPLIQGWSVWETNEPLYISFIANARFLSAQSTFSCLLSACRTQFLHRRLLRRRKMLLLLCRVAAAPCQRAAPTQ